MRKFFVLFVLTLFISKGCKNENNDIALTDSDVKANTILAYDNAFDVPVNNPAVIVTIDSLSFFESENLKNDNSTETMNLISEIKDLNKNFNVYDYIKKNTIRILDQNKYKYTFIDKFNKTDFPNIQINKENFRKIINFDKLKNHYKHDDIVLINIKNGFDYNEEDTSKYAAKTYVNIYIIDTKNQKLKYSESIAGTKYIDEPNPQISEEYLSEVVKESIENTIEIINKKY